jgi:hypothetical protein
LATILTQPYARNADFWVYQNRQAADQRFHATGNNLRLAKDLRSRAFEFD